MLSHCNSPERGDTVAKMLFVGMALPHEVGHKFIYRTHTIFLKIGDTKTDKKKSRQKGKCWDSYVAVHMTRRMEPRTRETYPQWIKLPSVNKTSPDWGSFPFSQAGEIDGKHPLNVSQSIWTSDYSGSPIFPCLMWLFFEVSTVVFLSPSAFCALNMLEMGGWNNVHCFPGLQND